jgi:hypothetical protein
MSRFPQITPKDPDPKWEDLTTQAIKQDLLEIFEELRQTYSHFKNDIELTRIFSSAVSAFWEKHKPQRLH